MTDLRKAAEMALEALESYPLPFQASATSALRQALAQPENQQPTKIFGPGLEEVLNAAGFYKKRVDETAKREHEPVVGTKTWFEDGKVVTQNLYASDIYTAPPKQEYQYEVVAEHANGTYTTKRIPKREWVGLTDREITKIGNLDWDSAYVGIWYDFAKAIEAKLKEKNT